MNKHTAIITAARIAELRAMQERLGNEGTGCWRNPIIDELLDAVEVIPKLLEALADLLEWQTGAEHSPQCPASPHELNGACRCGYDEVRKRAEAVVRKVREE